MAHDNPRYVKSGKSSSADSVPAYLRDALGHLIAAADRTTSHRERAEINRVKDQVASLLRWHDDAR